MIVVMNKKTNKCGSYATSYFCCFPPIAVSQALPTANVGGLQKCREPPPPIKSQLGDCGQCLGYVRFLGSGSVFGLSFNV